MLGLDVVHHHDRLHAGRRAVVATGISSTGRPGTLDRVATCARRVGHCISVSRSRSSQDAVVVVAHRDVARIARAQVCCAVRINVHRSCWLGSSRSTLGLHVVHHHDRLHAGRRAVVATGISSTGRPGALDRVATCARRVGHCISVSRSRSSQDAVVVVAHRDVARIARAQVCCAVRINVHRSCWLGSSRSTLGLDVVHHHDRLCAGRRAVVATGISSTGCPGTLDRVATCARRVGHCISVSRSRSSQDAVVVVAHRDVASIARAQVCCAVRINVHRGVGWAAQGHVRLDVVLHRDGLRATLGMIIATCVGGITRPSPDNGIAARARRIRHYVCIGQAQRIQHTIVRPFESWTCIGCRIKVSRTILINKHIVISGTSQRDGRSNVIHYHDGL